MTTKPTKAPRKRSPQPYKTKRRSAAAAKAQHRLGRDPEHRAKMIAAGARSADDRRKNPQRYSRKGVPDGMRKAEAMKAWAEARTKADGIMKILEDQGAVSAVVIPGSDDEKAKAARHEACLLALGPADKRTKLMAAGTVLKFTRVIDLVVQGVEAIAGFCLRFRVQRLLQFLNTFRS